MTARDISFTHDQDAQRREDELKLRALRLAIRVGTDTLNRGDFVEVDDAELDGYLEGLTARERRPNK
jgi:antitoxin ParD1/3/4